MDFLGRGFRFPLVPTLRARENPDAAGIAWSAGAEQIEQSIILILSTAPGERLMRPEFGCGIHDLVFEANTPAVHAMVRGRVRDALLRYEPRIELEDIEVEPDVDEPSLLLIGIHYRIVGGNQAHNLVFPFYLQEGAA